MAKFSNNVFEAGMLSLQDFARRHDLADSRRNSARGCRCDGLALCSLALRL